MPFFFFSHIHPWDNSTSTWKHSSCLPWPFSRNSSRWTGLNWLVDVACLLAYAQEQCAVQREGRLSWSWPPNINEWPWMTQSP